MTTERLTALMKLVGDKKFPDDLTMVQIEEIKAALFQLSEFHMATELAKASIANDADLW